MSSQPKFSEGSDKAILTKDLDGLTANDRWLLTGNGQGIQRSFKFKTFAKTWVSQNAGTFRQTEGERRLTDCQDFMTAVSLQCKLKNHHPEWSNVSKLSCP